MNPDNIPSHHDQSSARGVHRPFLAVKLIVGGNTDTKETEVAMTLHLEKQEASLAFNILKSRMKDLRTEVRHDRDSVARDYLKKKERILKSILSKFSGTPEMN